MEDDWESVADKPIVKPIVPENVNRWAGEDEDEDIKDSWEDEEEKKDEEKSEPIVKAPAEKKPTNVLKAKLSEEERLAREAEESRKSLAEMTPEDKLAEKLRVQKIQEESDLKVALETFGVKEEVGGLDAYNPSTAKEFTEFGAALSWKLLQYKESPHFPQFIEDVVRIVCANLTLAELKKIKLTVDKLTEKVKLDKESTKKAPSKAKAKISIKKGNDDIEGYMKYGNDMGDTYDDYDDFM